MQIAKDSFNQIAGYRPRKLLTQIVTLGATVGSALMMWNFMRLATNVESPIVVVLTKSMEPAFYRGDILLVTNRDKEVVPGDIMVFNIAREPIPIVHRAMIIQDEAEPRKGKEYYLLTKGDNNQADDRWLYKTGKVWLNKKDVIGKIKAYCPLIGYVTIAMNDNPWLKYLVLAILGGSVLLSNDPEE